MKIRKLWSSILPKSFPASQKQLRNTSAKFFTLTKYLKIMVVTVIVIFKIFCRKYVIEVTAITKFPLGEGKRRKPEFFLSSFFPKTKKPCLLPLLILLFLTKMRQPWLQASISTFLTSPKTHVVMVTTNTTKIFHCKQIQVALVATDIYWKIK